MPGERGGGGARHCSPESMRNRPPPRPRGRPPLPDAELVADIRLLVTDLPTYSYRRVYALRRRHAEKVGRAAPNRKRVYRAMKVHGLLLQRDDERREERRHEGRVAVNQRSTRRCSGGLEVACDNGEKVRVPFALDCCDREEMGQVATTSSITAEDVQDSTQEGSGFLWLHGPILAFALGSPITIARLERPTWKLMTEPPDAPSRAGSTLIKICTLRPSSTSTTMFSAAKALPRRDRNIKMLAWMRSFGSLQRVGIKCTGTYSAGLLRYLQNANVEILEVAAPDRQGRRRRGKNDDRDAQNAAHAAYVGRRTVTPKEPRRNDRIAPRLESLPENRSRCTARGTANDP
jgi:hypothetical protein